MFHVKHWRKYEKCLNRVGELKLDKMFHVKQLKKTFLYDRKINDNKFHVERGLFWLSKVIDLYLICFM